MLWQTYGDCDNYAELRGSKNAVLDLQWSADGKSIYSASADHTVSTWDVHTGTRIRKHEGHQDIVNAVDVHRRGTETLCSVADDATIGLWDPRTKSAIDYMQDEYSITAVAFSANGTQLFSGGLDEVIRVWDLRRRKVLYTLEGHAGTLTSLSVSPDGSTLLSNAMDNKLKLWNIQPFAPEDRLVRTIEGAEHGEEGNLLRSCWSADGKRVASGSADRTVMIWDAGTGMPLYKLPGHKGTVVSVDLHPHEPIVLTGSIDKTLLLGELA
ncbi:hypothetical protein PYCC9005_004019 [Savitreella phatthalungensis]